MGLGLWARGYGLWARGYGLWARGYGLGLGAGHVVSGGNCPLSYCSDITVRVEVTDINDHAPQFVFDANMSRYVAEISENSPASLILQLVATDEDSTSNGQIMFLPSTGKLHIISSGPRNFFQQVLGL